MAEKSQSSLCPEPHCVLGGGGPSSPRTDEEAEPQISLTAMDNTVQILAEPGSLVLNPMPCAPASPPPSRAGASSASVEDTWLAAESTRRELR